MGKIKPAHLIDWGSVPKAITTSAGSSAYGGWITDEQITTVLNGGTIHHGPNGPPSSRPESELSWLDRRVNEVRVRL